MKDRLRQITVILTILAAIVVNGLANALPINGQNTGEISDRFKVYFVPSGYVFSIWGIIYMGLIAFAIFQALPSQRENPRMKAAGWWVSLGGLANIAWIFLCHYEHFPLTLVTMPKQGSWLNMAEIELSVIGRQCLSGYISDTVMLERETSAWENERNAIEATVEQRFTTSDARIKLKKLYPVIHLDENVKELLPIKA